MADSAPVLIIVMGVSGCGKSTLADHLAQKYELYFIEADDFHSDENKAHMASGQPLTDAMREPWIRSLCDEITHHSMKGHSVVMAYSGLKRSHRARFRALGLRTMFLHLAGPKEVIARRMSQRDGHFMPISLLDSQFDALEATDEEPDIHTLDLSQTISDITSEAENLAQHLIEA